MVGTGRLHIKLYMSICTRENSSHPAQVFFLRWNVTPIVARYYRHVVVYFFDIIFFFIMKQNLRNKFQKTLKKNFFIAHIVTKISEVIQFIIWW